MNKKDKNKFIQITSQIIKLYNKCKWAKFPTKRQRLSDLTLKITLSTVQRSLPENDQKEM